jgi:hypothetical protein
VEKYVGAREATDDNIMRRMRVAFWITNATDTDTHTHTHSIYNTHCFFTPTMVTGTLLSLTYIYIYIKYMFVYCNWVDARWQ